MTVYIIDHMEIDDGFLFKKSKAFQDKSEAYKYAKTLGIPYEIREIEADVKEFKYGEWSKDVG